MTDFEMNKKQQVALIILDGWGHSENEVNNAIYESNTPFFDYLWSNYPHCFLNASEEHVGLPKGQPGNSEIGHTTIGAGKIIDTDLVRINKSIEQGEFFENNLLNESIEINNKNQGKIHVMGLIGEGGVHAHQKHWDAIIDLLLKKTDKKVSLHLFTDGRDAPPKDSLKYIEQIYKKIQDTNIFISTISGRYYSMDRDNNWERLEKFLNLFEEEDKKSLNFEEIEEQIKNQYSKNQFDEHIEPFVVKNSAFSKNDLVIIINFRSDRVRMLTSKLIEISENNNLELDILTMTEYNPDFKVKVIFPPIKIDTTLAKEISEANLTQAHIAETEKFPHATYFLNGGKQDPYKNEEHVLLESRKDIKTHDEAPEMRAASIADEAIKRIKAEVNFIFINFANPDMVGHTANKQAIKIAIEEVDKQLKRVVETLLENDGIALITADHGNAEINIDVNGDKHTSHTTNLVPCVITDKKIEIKNGGLCDIAPTILQILNIKKPDSMTGETIII